MKRNIFVSIILLSIAFPGFSADIIDLDSSNQSTSTVSYEGNEYDWLLNPLDFDKIRDSIIFFSLDGEGLQFGEDSIGSGFRGGWALEGKNFTSLYALNYYTTGSSSEQEVEENIGFEYNNWDTAAGRYGTINETVSTSSAGSSSHSLIVHFGGNPHDGPLDFAAQVWWNMDRRTGTTTSYTNQYSNTATATRDTLTSRGNMTVTTWNLINAEDSVLAIEPEVGLIFGDLETLIALGVGFYNLGTDDDTYITTVTSYSGGVDTTIADTENIDTYTGSYYYNSGLSSCFGMNTNSPNYVQRTLINLDTETTLPLNKDLDLTIPIYFGMSLYPSNLATTYTDTIVSYNDSEETPLETGRMTDTTVTTMIVGHDIDWGVSGNLRKTIETSENSAIYLGAGAGFAMELYTDTRTREYSERTQQDNNADGAYTTAGTDLDQTITYSGYEIRMCENIYTFSLNIPLAVSYSPVPGLTFHAGTKTNLYVTLTDSSSLETGDDNYIYQYFTDNLETDNSNEEPSQIDEAENASDPVYSFSTNYYFTVSGGFGFTLDITENFCIDAVAVGSNNMKLYSFSLTGIYSY